MQVAIWLARDVLRRSATSEAWMRQQTVCVSLLGKMSASLSCSFQRQKDLGSLRELSVGGNYLQPSALRFAGSTRAPSVQWDY